MKRITAKFHRVTRYTDPTGTFTIEVQYGLIGEKIMGIMTCSCEMFPPIQTILGPFTPDMISKIEKKAKEVESDGDISNLVFEDEIVLGGVEIEITKDIMNMN